MKHAAGLVATLLATAMGAAHAEDFNYGRNLAAPCMTCHGTNGRSVGVFESLAGLPAAKIEKILRDFRSGDKPGTVMPILARAYRDEQIEAIAAYFAAQRK